ncbi:hypothetical protein A3C57_02835 [Candidatus Nomurabacteria bacterium RIFCSPHIGHO2_02_FULL_33_12]|uniref:DUF4286 domain-containing protein n=1 Tax=Candidatus Nomurabacteria bacterium RIFCSPLOWO2_01_FULL_33_17 TaxID=1801764 RepID=A0A1F6WMW3_9BACT|nr:MAG: hypothetical protein A3C57_02835 [Candidatus Nomurabacteria bacterium RIFCSPHIGHO2_02_FULL_33_12]OGI83156.1 MAG: hypothetical protein A2903_01775 [Candidatus Nomurabacteria bacterium RIFCSPLOWO2_01_FULL_33_17]
MKTIALKLTISIKKVYEGEWFEWMAKEQIPDTINTGLIIDFFIHKMVSSILPEYVEYEIGYIFHYKKEYEEYMENFRLDLNQKHHQKFNLSSRSKFEERAYEDLSHEVIKLN